MHATLHPALSVGRSVGHILLFYEFYSLTLLLLPKWSVDLKYGPCPPARDWGSRVSGLVLNGTSRIFLYLFTWKIQRELVTDLKKTIYTVLLDITVAQFLKESGQDLWASESFFYALLNETGQKYFLLCKRYESSKLNGSNTRKYHFHCTLRYHCSALSEWKWTKLINFWKGFECFSKCDQSCLSRSIY